MKSEPGRPPLVTVGMPTYNREWSLPKVLESLHALDYDKKRIRLCFVDNGSQDATPGILEEFRGRHLGEYESILVQTLESGIPKARNAILREAEGTDFVFFLDSDVLPPPSALKVMLEDFRDPRVGLVSIPFDTLNARERTGVLYSAYVLPPSKHEAYKVAAGCTVVSSLAVKAVGEFDVRLRVHEDTDYCYRVRKAGFKVVCDSSIEGTHLRKIGGGKPYYLGLIRDSSVTYGVLAARGSPLHIAKMAGSILLVASLAWLLAGPGLAPSLVFLAALGFSVWLNSSPMALDDGIHVRMSYLIPVGLLSTAATTSITMLSIWRLVTRRGA